MTGPRGNQGKRTFKPIPEEGPWRCFVGNLPFDTIQGDFDTLFSGLTIKGIQMMRDRETDQFKGFAYVEFGSRDELVKALEVDGVEFDTRIVRVDVADDRSKQNQQRNRSPQNLRRGGRGGNNRHGQNRNHNDGQRNTEYHNRNHNEGQRNVEYHRPDESRRTSESQNTELMSGASGDESFQVVPTRKPRGGRTSRGNQGGSNRSRPDGNNRGQSDRLATSHPERGGSNVPRNGRGGRRQEPAPQSTQPPASDPSRPKLVLKPRTTDPIELERIQQREEEERKARLEKIYSAK